MTELALAGLCLALLYAVMTLVNFTQFRRAPRSGPSTPTPVSVLIPARDEAAGIEATLARVLATPRDIELELIVLDDHSSDDTHARVNAMAARDSRLHVIRGADLPPGCNGKQHACAQLAQAASHELMLFLDADVHLAPDAVGRAVAELERGRLDLVSGFPQQRMASLGEQLLLPMVHVLLLGYLPLFFARLSNHPMFAAGCGQFLLVRRPAYRDTGGHRAFIAHMHDGMRLPRLLRAAGWRTGIFDATDIAICRMYDGFRAAWRGFSKDATEGMATPVGLPVWSVLLVGGHVLPPVLVLVAALLGHGSALLLSLVAVAALGIARMALAWRTRQPWRSVALHPAAVLVTLALQWRCLWAAKKGEPARWRGRSYSR
jgi:hypothetical protein